MERNLKRLMHQAMAGTLDGKTLHKLSNRSENELQTSAKRVGLGEIIQKQCSILNQLNAPSLAAKLSGLAGQRNFARF